MGSENTTDSVLSPFVEAARRVDTTVTETDAVGVEGVLASVPSCLDQLAALLDRPSRPPVEFVASDRSNP